MGCERPTNTSEIARPRGLSVAVRAAAAFDRSQLDWRFAVRVTAGIAIVLVAAYATGQLAAGFPAAFGALSTGFASQQGVYRTRAAAMLWTAAAMAISTFIGSLAGHSLPALVIVTALWGYSYGIVASLGPAATTVGINSVIALIIYGHYPSAPPQALVTALLMFAGGLVQTFLLIMVWPLRRFSAERIALAKAARSLAVYARGIAGGTPGLPMSAPLLTVQQTLADPQPFARRGDIAVFQSLLDELHRIRNDLAGLATDREASTQHRGIDEFALGAAAILDQIAAALQAGKEPVDTSNEWLRLRAAEDRIERLDVTGEHTRGEVHALAGQLRSAWRLATLPADLPSSPASRNTPSPAPSMSLAFGFHVLQDTLATLRANLTQRSPYGRFAPRLAGTLAIATILGGILPTKHGYWIPMTAVILLRPDFTQTAIRGIGRVAGTLVGVVFATVIAAHVRPGTETYIALTILFSGIGYFVFKANYGLFTIAITGYVAFALALVGDTDSSALRDRVLGTVVAGILTAVAVFVWPTWEAGRARAALADLLDAQREYLLLVLRAYCDPSTYDAGKILSAQEAAWSLRANAEASVDRMLAEPERTYAIAPEQALGILAASRRVGLVSLSLNAHFPHAQQTAHPSLTQFTTTIDSALGVIVAALHETPAAAEFPHLREAYRQMQRDIESKGEPNAELLVSAGDTLVDAVNTLAELSGAKARKA